MSALQINQTVEVEGALKVVQLISKYSLQTIREGFKKKKKYGNIHLKKGVFKMHFKLFWAILDHVFFAPYGGRFIF